MILVKPSFAIEHVSNRSDVLGNLERYGRTCYKSEDRITEDSAEKFCKMILGRNHLSVIEHESMTVRFVCDRGVTHELVRHRLASFSQESTRYCNYKGGVAFVIPPWVDIEPGKYDQSLEMQDRSSQEWLYAMLKAETFYKALLVQGWTPQQARSVLPNSLKTEIVMTANLRQWMHVFKLRCDKSAHPQMRELMLPLQAVMQKELPEFFGQEAL